MSAPDSRFDRAYLPLDCEAPTGPLHNPSETMLVILSWLCVAAALAFGALVGLTVAHAIVTTWLELGPTLDRASVGGGW